MDLTRFLRDSRRTITGRIDSIEFPHTSRNKTAYTFFTVEDQERQHHRFCGGYPLITSLILAPGHDVRVQPGKLINIKGHGSYLTPKTIWRAPWSYNGLVEEVQNTITPQENDKVRLFTFSDDMGGESHFFVLSSDPRAILVHTGNHLTLQRGNAQLVNPNGADQVYTEAARIRCNLTDEEVQEIMERFSP